MYIRSRENLQIFIHSFMKTKSLRSNSSKSPPRIYSDTPLHDSCEVWDDRH